MILHEFALAPIAQTDIINTGNVHLLPVSAITKGNNKKDPPKGKK
jgi:hypothetical protein